MIEDRGLVIAGKRAEASATRNPALTPWIPACAGMTAPWQQRVHPNSLSPSLFTSRFPGLLYTQDREPLDHGQDVDSVLRGIGHLIHNAMHEKKAHPSFREVFEICRVKI